MISKEKGHLYSSGNRKRGKCNYGRGSIGRDSFGKNVQNLHNGRGGESECGQSGRGGGGHGHGQGFMCQHGQLFEGQEGVNPNSLNSGNSGDFDLHNGHVHCRSGISYNGMSGVIGGMFSEHRLTGQQQQQQLLSQIQQQRSSGFMSSGQGLVGQVSQGHQGQVSQGRQQGGHQRWSNQNMGTKEGQIINQGLLAQMGMGNMVQGGNMVGGNITGNMSSKNMNVMTIGTSDWRQNLLGKTRPRSAPSRSDPTRRTLNEELLLKRLGMKT